ncbi:MAG: hypothetical protein ACK559_37780, partial [bacterium]
MEAAWVARVGAKRGRLALTVCVVLSRFVARWRVRDPGSHGSESCHAHSTPTGRCADKNMVRALMY